MTRTDYTESAMTHTPGPWDYDLDYIIAPDPNGRHPDIYIAEIAHTDDEGRIASLEQQDANRRRICAAVNACEGISTEALEQDVIAELRHALELFLEFNDQWLIATDTQADLEHDRVMQMARAALAKTARSSRLTPRLPIVIEVRGGIVQEVLNVPPGYHYEVKDYDIIETDGGAA